jgi:hypothetical protein
MATGRFYLVDYRRRDTKTAYPSKKWLKLNKTSILEIINDLLQFDEFFRWEVYAPINENSIFC